MAKIYLRFLVAVIFLQAGFPKLQAQTITTAGNTTYTGTNGLSGNIYITFVVENTNSYPVLLSDMETLKTSSYPLAGATFTLWYSSTSLSGAPVVASPDWTQISNSSPAGLSNGYTTIFTNLGFTIPANTQYRFALQSSAGLAYSGSSAGDCSPSILTDGGVNLKLGDATINSSYVGYSGSFPNAMNSPRWFTGSITIQPAGPCTSPPMAGYIKPIVSGDSTTSVCSGSTFSLQRVGGTGGTGQTYQWQSSANGTTYTNISGATNASYTSSQTASTYYRVIITCGGFTATTAAVQMVSPALISGSFNINNTLPTGGNNFQSFTDAINYLKCGIGGRVIFNVAAGSGPYNEQVVIPQISGVSAANTITIYGNGRTLNFNSTNSNKRDGIKLDGADYVTIDNLIINGTGSASTDYNYAVHLMNDANNNTITNCTINLINSSSSVNFVGIVIGGTVNSATSTGTGLPNGGNTISGNTINGGYYSIVNVGVSTTLLANSNRITNNTIVDFSSYGIYTSYTSGMLIEGNDINRRNRSLNIFSFYGIFLTNVNFGAVISKNRIHDPFSALTASNTNIAAGIYLSAADGKIGQENVVSNNLIYNFTNGGTMYGFYNSSSDSTLYYYNTVVLDDSNYVNTSTSYVTYGFYQLSVATGIQLKNNLFRIVRGGAANKFGLYFGTSSSNIVSNNNDLIVAGSVGNYFTGYFASNLALLADWQNGSFQDGASVAIQPLFFSPSTGNFRPTATALDNKGTPVSITTDINGNTRSTTTPDMGAFEFGPPLPIKLLSLAAAKAGKDILVSWTATAETGFSHYEIERSADGNAFSYVGSQAYRATGSNSNSYSFTDKDAAATATGIIYYRLKMVDKDGRFTYSAVVSVRLKGASVEIVKAYPNPFKSTLYLQAESTTVTVLKATLTDVAGRVLLTKNYPVVSGSNVLVMDGLEKVQTGTYLLSIDINGQKTTLKITK